jgi:hypothetical protein
MVQAESNTTTACKLGECRERPAAREQSDETFSPVADQSSSAHSSDDLRRD